MRITTAQAGVALVRRWFATFGVSDCMRVPNRTHSAPLLEQITRPCQLPVAGPAAATQAAPTQRTCVHVSRQHTVTGRGVAWQHRHRPSQQKHPKARLQFTWTKHVRALCASPEVRR